MTRDDFITAVLRLYRHLAGAHVHPRRADRELATAWHARGITIPTIEAAMLLAVARRTSRPLDATPLQPIRSLHYFASVLDEITSQPLDERYVDYLRRRKAPPRGDRPNSYDSR